MGSESSSQVLDLKPAIPGFSGLGEDYYSRVAPTPVPAPKLLAFNADAASLAGLAPSIADDPAFLARMAGAQAWPGASPIATVYAGHQFGVFVPQLGDGRAILAATLTGPDGTPWELQLKGAGKTPYSRFGDGRAVLRSSIREYLCGEAMAGLGIPTTRTLCLVGSDEPVQRESVETAAVICRMAPSHVRFGHFEYFYHRQQFDKLKPLADYLIDTYWQSQSQSQSQGKNRYADWLTDVVERTARLMAQWQSVGFVHGVMNSDNFSILGLTLDYGPYGFLDEFAAGKVFNHTDENGRYAYAEQPAIGHWNCTRLLQATLPLLHEDPDEAVKIAYGVLDHFGTAYVPENLRLWRAKLGLREPRDSDPELVNGLLKLMDRTHADFANTFRALAKPEAARDWIADTEAFDAWLRDYRARLASEQSDDAERAVRMNAANPKYLLRTHLVQAAIDKAQAGDPSEIEALRRLLMRPFDEQPGMERYAAAPPPGQHVELSCSS